MVTRQNGDFFIYRNMSRIICLCNKVSQKKIETLIKKSPAASISDVINATAASTSCGRCRSELESVVLFCKKEHSPGNKFGTQLFIPFNE